MLFDYCNNEVKVITCNLLPACNDVIIMKAWRFSLRLLCTPKPHAN